MTTVKDITTQYLDACDADGLCNPNTDAGCGCPLANLMPCQGCSVPPAIDNCVPGYRRSGHKFYPTRQAAANAEKGITDDNED